MVGARPLFGRRHPSIYKGGFARFALFAEQLAYNKLWSIVSLATATLFAAGNTHPFITFAQFSARRS
jgi:hypothetical protein